MELFKELRQKIGKTLLENKVARNKRGVSYSNFSKIKSIGIVWDASRTSEFHYLSRFHQEMMDLKIDLMIFGYFPGKNLPDQYTAIRYFRCIKKDDLNSFYHPVSKEADKFINNPFDVLIDINFDNIFPLKCVTSLSKAKFKVGIFDPDSKNPVYDMMMELKKPVEVAGYMSQIIHYLEMIKDKTPKKQLIN